MYFAETEKLRYRACREADVERVMKMYNDPRNIRTNASWLVPKSEPAYTKELAERIPTALMFVVVEAKEPLADGEDWVGVTMLFQETSPKNRDISFAINLAPAFWGKGHGEDHSYLTYFLLGSHATIGKEITRWMVDHAFRQLGMHRVSLNVVGDNDRAIALYKSM